MAPPPSKAPYTPRPPAPVIDLVVDRRKNSEPERPSGVIEAHRAASRLTPTMPPPPPSAPPPPSLHSTDSVERTPSGFAAHIDGASIAELVQLECLRGLTRAVRVTADDGLGFLYFDHGQLVHAVCGRLTGEEAALAILSWRSGTARPSDSYYSKPPTINTPWQGLLLTAAQRQDDAARSPMTSEVLSTGPGEETFDLVVEVDVSSDAVLRSVRMDEEGHVLASSGEPEDFADTVAYCLALARLVGDGFGLDEFRGLECMSKEKLLIAYPDGEAVVAVEALPSSDLSLHREKAGT